MKLNRPAPGPCPLVEVVEVVAVGVLILDCDDADEAKLADFLDLWREFDRRGLLIDARTLCGPKLAHLAPRLEARRSTLRAVGRY